MIPVFDGHNDFLLRLIDAPDRRETTWLTGDGTGHLDLPRMKAGGFAGGFFAIYIPSPEAHDSLDYMTAMENPPFRLPLPDLIDHHTAQPVALSMAGHLRWMERASDGAFKVCTTVAELRDCLAKGVIAGIMHMEGAEAIGPDLDALYLYHDMGLRSLGPVWSRPTVFGHGVPFAFPSSPDTGDGLTEAGKALVVAYNKWDLTDEERRRYLEREVERDVQAFAWAPHVNISALTGRNVDKLRKAIDAALEGWETRISTGQLNSFLGRVAASHPHPVRGGKQPRILFGTQAHNCPPTFALFTTGGLDPQYTRFVERRLREEFGFVGTPINIEVRARQKRANR